MAQIGIISRPQGQGELNYRSGPCGVYLRTEQVGQ